MLELQEIIAQHCAKYPGMQVQDVVKLTYQNEFGCEHLLTDAAQCLASIQEEQKAAQPDVPYMLIGNGLCRLHLSCGLKPETICAMVLHTAHTHHGAMERFLKKLMLVESRFGVDCLQAYRAEGCPSVHHSNVYRDMYHPSYRVVKAEYAYYLDIFRKIDAGACRVAIDGRSAAGKSTLAELLTTVYDCNVLHTDDFFLQAHQRTVKRYQEPGGNIDYERLGEVVHQLGSAFQYQKFNCKTMTLDETVVVSAKPLSIVEGVYSLHPTFANCYDCKVFLGISSEKQKKRLLVREGEQMTERYLTEWIPLENRYFTAFSIPETCHLRYYVS